MTDNSLTVAEAPPFVHFSLSNNSIGAEGACALAAGLKYCPLLKSLQYASFGHACPQ